MDCLVPMQPPEQYVGHKIFYSLPLLRRFAMTAFQFQIKQLVLLFFLLFFLLPPSLQLSFCSAAVGKVFLPGIDPNFFCPFFARPFLYSFKIRGLEEILFFFFFSIPEWKILRSHRMEANGLQVT